MPDAVDLKVIQAKICGMEKALVLAREQDEKRFEHLNERFITRDVYEIHESEARRISVALHHKLQKVLL